MSLQSIPEISAEILDNIRVNAREEDSRKRHTEGRASLSDWNAS
jgi:hypothetical protein